MEFTYGKEQITPEQRALRTKLGEMMAGAGIRSMEDIQNLFKDMIGSFVENGLEGELEDELGYGKYDYQNKGTDNSRNGHNEKTLRTSFGEVDIKGPRDRKGEFEPELVKKQQTSLSGDIEEKILSMYSKGMSVSDIEGHIQEIYGLEISDSAISRITDKILPVVREWPGGDLCGGVSGRDPLSRADGRTDREKSGVHRDRSGYGWAAGRTRHVHRREREREVLADGAEQPEEPRRKRHPDRLRGRADGLPQCHRGGIPANGTAEVRDPPDPKHHAVRFVDQAAYGRSEARVCCGGRADRPERT